MAEFNETILEVSKLFLEFNRKNLERKELKEVCRLLDILENSRELELNTNDPRFNSLFWKDSVRILTEQIEMGFSWFQAYAKWYEDHNDPESGPSGDYPIVIYYADNTIVRILSCRDKLALMVYAFFKYFDPENENHLQSFQKIIKSLEKTNQGWEENVCESFLKHLRILENKDFDFLKDYRDYKTHRFDPFIIMGKIGNYHYRDYRHPLSERNEIARWEQEMRADNHYNDDVIEILKNGSTFEGVQYRTKKLEKFLWEFAEIRGAIESCTFQLFDSFAGCLEILIDHLGLQNSNE